MTPSDSLHGETLPPLSTDSAPGRGLPCLTIAYHPDLSRVGERFVIEGGGDLELSRLAPIFEQVRGVLARPLADRRLSRSPVKLHAVDTTLIVTPSRAGILRIGGEPRDRPTTLTTADLDAGAVLCLSRRVVLIAHLAAVHGRAPELDIIGESDGIERVRRAIEHAAALELAVLISGETGAGKEKVARALHRASTAEGAPFVAVNMAALAADTAAAALFGVAGDDRRPGLFSHAAGGSILFDEIGETPREVQSMLLRVIESRSYRPSGTGAERRIAARIGAATDRSLGDAVDGGTFRAALLHRLAAYEIAVPPLRARRDDIGRLVAHFAADQLRTLGRPELLDDRGHESKPWFPPDLMERLVLADWPGNVRELANAIRQLVIAGTSQRTLSPSAALAERIGRERAASPRTDADALLAALRANDWALGPTAASLGLPRSTLYDRMAKAKIRTARDIPDDELAEAHERLAGDVDAISGQLEVSRRAVVLRLRAMGLLER
jgi:two-component system nitrogen regulation response regulator GlnG